MSQRLWQPDRPMVAVYCGARLGHPDQQQVAQQFGQGLAQAGFGLIYGGAAVGLMGLLADAALQAGAPVWGVMPRMLATRELLHPHLTRLDVVGSLAERKQQMMQHAQAFVALAGGLGTLDELLEIATLAQLGQQRAPIAVCNSYGYFDGLATWMQHAMQCGLLSTADAQLIQFYPQPEQVLDFLKNRIFSKT